MLATGVSAVGMRNNLAERGSVDAFLYCIILVGELGELADAHHAIAIDQKGRRNLGVAVLVVCKSRRNWIKARSSFAPQPV